MVGEEGKKTPVYPWLTDMYHLITVPRRFELSMIVGKERNERHPVGPIDYSSL